MHESNIKTHFDGLKPLVAHIHSNHPTQEELYQIIRDSKVLSGGDYLELHIMTNRGKLYIGRWCGGYMITFPLNEDNCYQPRFRKDIEKKVADWICKEWNHLCWNDFHYTSPAAFKGDNPKTLDEACVYFRNLRSSNNWNQDIKEYVTQRFLDLTFEEAKNFANKLNMPFNRLYISSSFGPLLAYTDGQGKIILNTNCLFQDADTIRQILVHELCQHVSLKQGSVLCKAKEDSMLQLGLIPRPCAYSDKLIHLLGIVFPTGKYCPGYDFENPFYHDTPGHTFMDKVSIGTRE